MTNTPADPDSSPVEIFCMNCDYNLTGSPGNRCSECGEPFDRAKLTDWVCRPKQPMRLNLDTTGLRRFTGVFLASLFAPKRVGRYLSPCVNSWEAFRYSLVIRLCAALLVPVVTILVQAASPEWTLSARDIGLLLVTFGPVVVLASLTSDLLITAMLVGRVEPHQVQRKNRFSFWFAVCCAFSPHLIFWTATLTVYYAAADRMEHMPSDAYLGFLARLMVLGFVAFLGCALWWWFCLGRAIGMRGARTLGKWFIVASIPLLGATGAYIAGTFCGLCVWLFANEP